MQTKLVVFQPTSLCNLDCAYCYVPNRTVSLRMQDDVLESAIEKILRSPLVQSAVEFLWHAGEPLLAGRAFFERAIELIQMHNRRETVVTNVVQTNATMVTDEWARFLSSHDFGVGVSIDGPAWLHDSQRAKRTGAPSHDAVLRGVETLRNHGIEPGAICVLTRASLDAPEELFSFFYSHGFRSIAFNVDETENLNKRSSLSLDKTSVDAYRSFMDRFFDCWWPYRAEFRVREFDDFGQVFAAYRADERWSRPVWETEPLSIVTIQRNGDITTYSPEFAGWDAAAWDNFVIGNVKRIEEWDDLASSHTFHRISTEVDAGIALCRSTCETFPVCGGAFLSNKFAENGTIRSTETTTCVLHRQTLADVLIEKLGSRVAV